MQQQQQQLCQYFCSWSQNHVGCSTDPGGSGPGLTAGTRGDTAGLAPPAGCLAGVAVAADVEDVDGLASEGGEGAEAFRDSASESDGPLLESTGTEPLLVDAEEIRRRGDSILQRKQEKQFSSANLVLSLQVHLS